MNSPRVRFALFLVAAAAAGFCGPASAETVKAKLAGKGLGQAVSFVYDTHIFNVFAGEYRWLGDASNRPQLAGSFLSFCIDLNQTISVGSTYDYALRPVEAAPRPSPDNPAGGAAGMGPRRADELRVLWGEHRDDVTNGVAAAAFQIAVWEIVFEKLPSYGAPSLDVTAGSGSFYLKSGTSNYAAIKTLANQWIAEAANPSASARRASLAALSNDMRQDQLVAVPAPSAAAAGLGLLGGLVAFRRLRSRGRRAPAV